MYFVSSKVSPAEGSFFKVRKSDNFSPIFNNFWNQNKNFIREGNFKPRLSLCAAHPSLHLTTRVPAFIADSTSSALGTSPEECSQFFLFFFTGLRIVKACRSTGRRFVRMKHVGSLDFESFFDIGASSSRDYS